MKNNEPIQKTMEELRNELEELRHQLDEANETIDAIRTGQIDALVVEGKDGHQLYTLKTADHTYRVFIEKMSEGAVTVNREGIILYSNSQFARMINMPLNGIIGHPFEKFVVPENKTIYSVLFNESWKSDGKGEVSLISGNNITPVQLSLTTLELQEGVSLSIIITDLTSQKATQKKLRDNFEQLEQANQALEISNHDLQQFASVASHDLQEPLRKIQVFSNLLKEKQKELTVDSERYLDKIIESASRMKNLIIDILNYSRLSADDHKLECVDLSEVVKELMVDFELMIQDKNAVIQVGKLPCLYVNRGQVRQVFQNIISNALKFSKPGNSSRININSTRISEKSFNSPLQEDGPYCLIRIRDNGIGFNEKYLASIFALFERLHSKDKYEGTGIGMAIAKKIIDKHNGLITAVSHEGEGAEFRIILPIDQKDV